jgi:hypothetical protein
MASALWTATSHESLIGPPSELIHVDDFQRSSCESAVLTAPELLEEISEDIDPALQESVASECRWVSRMNNRATR